MNSHGVDTARQREYSASGGPACRKASAARVAGAIRNEAVSRRARGTRLPFSLPYRRPPA